MDGAEESPAPPSSEVRFSFVYDDARATASAGLFSARDPEATGSCMDVAEPPPEGTSSGSLVSCFFLSGSTLFPAAASAGLSLARDPLATGSFGARSASAPNVWETWQVLGPALSRSSLPPLGLGGHRFGVKQGRHKHKGR